MEDDAYKQAYLREKKARQVAEKLLADKSRELYDNVLHLEGVVKELKTTQTQLFHAEKMASVGQLAAGVAHEINNPIGFSHSNLNTLKDYIDDLFKLDNVIDSLPEEPEQALQMLSSYLEIREEIDLSFIKEDVSELLDDTIDGLDRVKDIVSNLKKVSHKGTAEHKECNINEVIEDCLKVVSNEIKYILDVEKDLSECPNILGQQSELSQVFINMFINAAHACEDKGILQIKTAHNQGWITVQIKDNGKGIEQDIVSKIFDPFFTTKELGKGTGLGLSVSHGIIEKHGGKIRVESQIGNGTSFFVELPVVDS
jgi:C4-dicarboxylate-specific signal transduction histidine kinase